VRILHFNQFGTNAGGVEGYIADVSRALVSEGHETQLVSFASEAPSTLLPNTTQLIGPNLEAVLAGIERVIAGLRPEVAYLHAVYNPQIVRYLGGRLPTVAYVHSPYLICPGYALFLRRSGQVCGRTAGPGCLVKAQIERCCFGRNPIRHLRRLHEVRALLEAVSQVDVLVGSQFMRHRLIANGLRAVKVSLLTPLLFAEPTSEYVSPSHPEVILFAGRVTLEKGLRKLIRALATVRGDWRLIVAGDGPDRDTCELLAEQLDLAERVEFAGWVAPAEMKILYQRCAFVAMPSLWPEPYGRVGPEAFLHGRPVVAYAVGGIPDWLEDGETGYLATPGDVEDLCGAITRLIESPAERERMGRTARDRAGMRWNAEAHIQRLVARFQAAIRGFRDGTAYG